MKIEYHPGESNTNDMTALQKALIPVQSAINDYFERPTQISVFTSLQELRMSGREALIKLNMLAPLKVEYMDFLSRPETALYYAYRLDTCETVSLPQDCDPDFIHAGAVCFDFDGTSLRIWLIEVDEGVMDTYGGPGDVNIHESASPKTSNVIHTQLMNLLDQYTAMEDFPGRHSHNYKPHRSDIPIAMISGDPTPDSVDAVRQAISSVFPDKELQFQDSIAPSEIMAVGAARRARHITDNPDDFKVYPQYILMPPDYQYPPHDEL